MKILKINRLLTLTTGALILASCATQPPPPPPPPEKSPEVVEPLPPSPKYIQVALRDADIIGQKIWMNEGSAKIENLTVWNKGEDFASLGIGHFIWYPAGRDGRFTETFPALLAFLQQQSIDIPVWLRNTPDAPWNSYEAFKLQEQSQEMTQLRTLLLNTIPQQAQFIIRRLEKALPKMVETLPTEKQRNQVLEQFYRVAETPNGIYALVDYVNFKGEGTALSERYQGQGWGLLQVLENMAGNTANVMEEYAQAAEFVLRRRIQNSSPERNESRWFPGWKNRVNTYTYQL